MTTWIFDKIMEEYYNSDEYHEYVKQLNLKPKKSKINNNIFTAAKAREKLNKVFEEDDSELITIMEKIDAAIKRKQNYVYISSLIGNHTIKKLQILGYSVGDIIKGDRPFDSDTRKISW